MKRKVPSLRSTTRKRTSAGFTSRQPNAESELPAKKVKQAPKKFSFVWLAEDVNQSKRIEGYLKRLEKLLPCALSTDSYDECEQWLLKYHGDENLLLIVSDKLAKSIVSNVHLLSSIVGIYVYSTDLEAHFEWTDDYAKVRRVLPPVSQIVKRLSRDLEIFESVRNGNVENDEAGDDDGVRDGKEIEGQIQENPESALTMFHFVIVDIVKRLNPRATAMLTALITMTEGGICIIDDGATVDINDLSRKPTFLCVSSSYAAVVKHRPKQIKAVFILEEDECKVDHREHFENGEDLIFELADEIYRCYKKEAAAYATTGDLNMALGMCGFSEITEILTQFAPTLSLSVP